MSLSVMLADLSLNIQTSIMMEEKQNLVMDGLFFPGDLDEYMTYYMHIRMYDDLKSKYGYIMPKDIIYILLKVFGSVVNNQIPFLNSVLPSWYKYQITDMWSFVTMICLAITQLRYPDEIKKRMRNCAYLFQIYYELNLQVEKLN